jgi:hypothetical protein
MPAHKSATPLHHLTAHLLSFTVSLSKYHNSLPVCVSPDFPTLAEPVERSHSATRKRSDFMRS